MTNKNNDEDISKDEDKPKATKSKSKKTTTAKTNGKGGLGKDKKTLDNAVDLVKKSIQRKYGEVIFNLDGDIRLNTISTGCINLDLALGNGGMALGKIYEVFGPNSSGKSTLAMSVINQAQKNDMRCCYIDAEHAVDPALMRSYGINTSELELVKGYGGEDNLSILESLVKTDAFSVAVVDSVSALVPQAESEADIDKDTIALQARLMSKVLRRLVPVANQTETLIIFINQLRNKIGAWGDPSTTSGGEALGFYSTGRIFVQGGEVKKRRLEDPKTGEIIGHNTVFEVKKNKLAGPFKKAEVKLIYGRGYDHEWEILDMAVSLGLIEQTGAWYKYNDSNLAMGEVNTVECLKDPENAELFNEIRSKVIDTLGLKEIYESHSQQGPKFS